MRLLFTIAEKNYINLKSMRSVPEGANCATCNHFTSSTFSLTKASNVNPAGLLQQPSDCKQSTLPHISSSPAVCLSIAHCLLRCNSRMSQSQAPASSPFFGGSAECFNCPRAGGWIALQKAQCAANKPKTLQWTSISLKTCWCIKRWVNYEL